MVRLRRVKYLKAMRNGEKFCRNLCNELSGGLKNKNKNKTNQEAMETAYFTSLQTINKEISYSAESQHGLHHTPEHFFFF